jgi:hypothetical protein
MPKYLADAFSSLNRRCSSLTGRTNIDRNCFVCQRLRVSTLEPAVAPRIKLAPILLTVMSALAIAGDPPVYRAELIEVHKAPDARQGVAVDGRYFYAADNYSITKHDKQTGEAVQRWTGRAAGDPLVHLDSLATYEGKLYAAHSNYPEWPMTSSVEIWDTETLEHIGTHSFGIDRGSFTWLDRHDGYWWGAFANYDKVQEGQSFPYGETDRTQVVKMDDSFAVIQSWTIPQDILNRFRPMSNSGGSWGLDGYLYLTGHDLGEAYVMSVPEAGSVLAWIATVKVPLMEGQGVAWDRAVEDGHFWAIVKKDRKVLKIAMPEVHK